jgi:aminoglycoside phosphotransferase (APT) family kinase protein
MSGVHLPRIPPSALSARDVHCSIHAAGSRELWHESRIFPVAYDASQQRRCRVNDGMTQRMHDDEIDIDESLVRRLVADQFPQWSNLPISRVSSTSTVNAIFRLGDDMSVRLARTPRFHDIDKEVCWLRALAGNLPLAIPEPLAVGERDKTYPWKWAVFRWIEGEPWREDGVHDLSAEATRLAEFLLALESLDPATIRCP